MVRRRLQICRLARAAAVSSVLAAALGVGAGLPVFATDHRSDPAAAHPAAAQDALKPAKKTAAEKLNEPWPDAEKMERQRAEAERLALFAGAEPLAFTLSADFGAINKIRDPDSTERLPGVLTLTGEDGTSASFSVQLGSRGHLRLNPRTCSMVPLRVDFVKKEVVGSVFDGQNELKLVTHCQNDKEYEQNVLAEYLAYRICNLFTPLSFRARLVRATYIDSKRNKTVATRYGAFLEDDKDVARRNGGRVIPLPNQVFKALDQDSLMVMSLVQFMLGNTDYSIVLLHNIRLVQPPAGPFRLITYDFDLSGLVNAPYAIPARGLGIKTVRDRYYRGPCLSVEQLEPWLARFRRAQDDVMALVEEPDFPPGEGWHYSNTGYYLARLIIEAETGMPISQALRTRLLKPLGLDDTWVECDKSAPEGVEFAHAWANVNGDGNLDDISGQSPNLYCSILSSPTWTTAEDLARWSQALFDEGKVLSEQSLTEMLSFVPASDPTEPLAAEYGLGVGKFNFEEVAPGNSRLADLEHYGHSGNVIGYNALMIYLPQHHATVVALFNENFTIATTAGPLLEVVDRNLSEN